MATPFNTERLKTVRRAQGISARSLGDMIGLSHMQILNYEKGVAEPQGDVLDALALRLRVLPEFFFGSHDDIVQEWQCNFRADKGAADYTKQRFASSATLFAMIVHHIRSEETSFEQDIPRFVANSLEEVEKSAEKARVHWGLPLDVPLAQVSRVFERSGVFITHMGADPSETIDAFSRYGDVSFVVLSYQRGSASRWRFTVGHEMGHGVLGHGSQALSLSHEEKELQANRFAAAFLLPRAAFSREFLTYGHDLEGLTALMERWGASRAAIVRRARELEILDVADYGRWFKIFNKNGWRKGEPDFGDSEIPELFTLALDDYTRRNNCTLADIAKQLGMSAELFAELTNRDVANNIQSPQISSLEDYKARKAATRAF